MPTNAVAYYHWPTVWVGSRPPISGGTIDHSALDEEVYRTTLSIGISSKTSREGMFFFDFSGWKQDKGLNSDSLPDFDAKAAVILNRVAVLNTHLACLYTALYRRQNFSIEKMLVSPSNLITMDSLDATGMGFSDARTAHLALSRYTSSYSSHIPITFDWRIAMRSVLIEKDTVDYSYQLLDTILQHSAPHVLIVTDVYARSCKAYEEHNYSLCLVTAWAIIEKLLQHLWEYYVETNRERGIGGDKVSFINKERKKKLTESRDFSASVISEILSLTNNLPFSLYKDMSKVRQVRNDWLHDLEPVSRRNAGLSVKVAQEMLNLVDGFELEVPLNSSLHW